LDRAPPDTQHRRRRRLGKCRRGRGQRRRTRR
jgi:hypothetical protein